MIPGERLYSRLLRLYPEEFRLRYGAEMLDFYRERRRAGRRIWPRLLLDLLFNATAERLRSEPSSRSEQVTMSTLFQDLRLALRGLARSPGFTAVVLLTLGLGIGANAAIFSVVNGVLLQPLPFPDPDRIVDLRHAEPYWNVSEPEFQDYRQGLRGIETLAAYTGYDANLEGNDQPVRITGTRVSDGFFQVLGVPPLIGRTFLPDEQKPSQAPAPVVVLSEGAWRTYFGADKNILTREIRLNGVPRRVIGVMPASFGFPEPTTSVWLPLRLNYDSLWTRNNHYVLLVGRLKPGATAKQQDLEANLLTHRWVKDFPQFYAQDKPFTAELKPLSERMVSKARPYLVTLLAAVGLVLLIACANVANLLLIRGEARRRELGIRTALGASRSRLVAQQLTESVVLALAGGGLGLLLAYGGVKALLSLAPATLPRLEQVHLNGIVLLFTGAVSLGTGLLFGLLPAFRSAQGGAAPALREGLRSSSTRRGSRTRRVLVLGEVALAMVMLSGAGLLLRSLLTLQHIDLGLDPANILTARLNLPPLNYQDNAKVTALMTQLEERVKGLPGVVSVAAMGWAPVVGDGGTWSIMLDGQVAKDIASAPAANPQQVTPGYFETLGNRLVRGRAFTAQDREDAPPVAIINEAMARKFWPGVDPIGHRLKMFGEQSPWVDIVGLARDIRSSGVEKDVPPTMYFPFAQSAKSAYYMPRQMTLAVRTKGNPEALGQSLTRLVHQLDPGAPVSELRSMETVMGTALASRRFTTVLLGGFAGLALLLAGLGIYGVIAYGVSQRTYEIGLRQALGADRGAVLRLIVTEGLRLAAMGLALGLLGTLVAGRLIRSLLVSVTATDPLTLVAMGLTLAAVAALASWIPARRATAVSPTEALKG